MHLSSRVIQTLSDNHVPARLYAPCKYGVNKSRSLGGCVELLRTRQILQTYRSKPTSQVTHLPEREQLRRRAQSGQQLGPLSRLLALSWRSDSTLISQAIHKIIWSKAVESE